MESQHTPTEVRVHGESKPQKVMSVWTAIVIGLSIIIATAIVVGGIIFLRSVDTIEKIESVDINVSDNPKDGNASVNIQANQSRWGKMKRYMDDISGGVISFQYPEKYVLSHDAKGAIRITSVPIPTVDEVRCRQFEDGQARVSCLNPANALSPNINIKFLTGDAQELWEGAMIFPGEGSVFVTPFYTWHHDQYGGEFGGIGMYGLPTPDGLWLATYQHWDIEGGDIFVQSPTYQLDHHQQKELLEDILATFELR